MVFGNRIQPANRSRPRCLLEWSRVQRPGYRLTRSVRGDCECNTHHYKEALGRGQKPLVLRQPKHFIKCHSKGSSLENIVGVESTSELADYEHEVIRKDLDIDVQYCWPMHWSRLAATISGQREPEYGSYLRPGMHYPLDLQKGCRAVIAIASHLVKHRPGSQ